MNENNAINIRILCTDGIMSATDISAYYGAKSTWVGAKIMTPLFNWGI